MAPVEGVAAVSGVSGPGAVAALALDAVRSQPAASASSMTDASAPTADFTTLLGQAADRLAAQQQSADDLGVQAVTGQLDDVHDYTIAATEVQVALELTATIRDKAVAAFNDIMRMQA